MGRWKLSNRIPRQQHPLNQPWLPTNLSHIPARQGRNPSRKHHEHQYPQEPNRKQFALPEQSNSGKSHQDHEGSQTHHHPKTPEHRCHRRMKALKLIQSPDKPIRIAGHDQATELRNTDLHAIPALLPIR
ncbi:MAG: hypothetical protein BWY82_02390 [Verrucomicrobia bacterium ADurb.Bin474]|nr:MAG: hypothetical protein BWY82_02390 [Verrucomicrobia bacterium ADurb.Bin474]